MFLNKITLSGAIKWEFTEKFKMKGTVDWYCLWNGVLFLVISGLTFVIAQSSKAGAFPSLLSH